MGEVVVPFIAPGSVAWYKDHWSKCDVAPTKKSMVERETQLLLGGKKRYQLIEQQTLVPWQMVGVIHGLESSFNFHTYLGNGEPLSVVTRLVPAGRGPFKDWEAGAFDALKYDGLLQKSWDLYTMLQSIERYNGTGYLRYHPAHLSPYLWSCTTIETAGRYTGDGKFDPSARSLEVGVVAYFKQLAHMGEMGLFV